MYNVMLKKRHQTNTLSQDSTPHMRSDASIHYKVSDLIHNTQERKQIEEQAKADGTWLKAPNGQPTNLTPEQWVTVRTRRFKEWFGDWEKAFIYDYITKLVAVKAKQMPANKSSEEVFKSLPTAKNKIDGLEVNFFNSAFGKIVKTGGISETIIATLPEIFEESILAYSEKSEWSTFVFRNRCIAI